MMMMMMMIIIIIIIITITIICLIQFTRIMNGRIMVSNVSVELLEIWVSLSGTQAMPSDYNENEGER
jgi:hypothetical protein